MAHGIAITSSPRTALLVCGILASVLYFAMNIFIPLQWQGYSYWAFRPKWLQGTVGFLFVEPSTWIMQTRQFAGIKRRAEREARHPLAHSARWMPTPSDRTFS